ncbi:MAG: DUF2059 domain-containing protein [Flavobacterium sp.]|jgi:hypothetical protein|uniref:DUF2059 domain-containing protein n=1 Tax=Flavobacterium sp. TaxID=239 RepID=UPI002C2F56C8|nr:DUF2059 domain-containing protein [Flavobacterium sp.]HQA73975.1 DUF2059 domain-containing protein [Flavobacterium sp.]
MKKLVFTVAFAILSTVSFAQEKASKADVLKVIERSGAQGQMNAAKKQILTMIPADKQAAFLIEFDAIIAKSQDKTADLYIEEYTKDDIKAMLAFYESPVGKKMAEKSEKIAEKQQASMMELQGEIQTMMMKYMQ